MDPSGEANIGSMRALSSAWLRRPEGDYLLVLGHGKGSRSGGRQTKEKVANGFLVNVPLFQANVCPKGGIDRFKINAGRY